MIQILLLAVCLQPPEILVSMLMPKDLDSRQVEQLERYARYARAVEVNEMQLRRGRRDEDLKSELKWNTKHRDLMLHAYFHPKILVPMISENARVGEIGQFSHDSILCKQVISKTSFRGSVFSDSDDFIVEGYDTSLLKDNSIAEVAGIYFSTESITYTTVLGTPRTVAKFERLKLSIEPAKNFAQGKLDKMFIREWKGIESGRLVSFPDARGVIQIETEEGKILKRRVKDLSESNKAYVGKYQARLDDVVERLGI